MAKKKGLNNFEYTYVEREITYVCPVRGVVTEKVKGKQYLYKGTPEQRKYVVELPDEGDMDSEEIIDSEV